MVDFEETRSLSRGSRQGSRNSGTGNSRRNSNNSGGSDNELSVTRRAINRKSNSVDNSSTKTARLQLDIDQLENYTEMQTRFSKSDSAIVEDSVKIEGLETTPTSSGNVRTGNVSISTNQMADVQKPAAQRTRKVSHITPPDSTDDLRDPRTTETDHRSPNPLLQPHYSDKVGLVATRSDQLLDLLTPVETVQIIPPPDKLAFQRHGRSCRDQENESHQQQPDNEWPMTSPKCKSRRILFAREEKALQRGLITRHLSNETDEPVVAKTSSLLANGLENCDNSQLLVGKQMVEVPASANRITCNVDIHQPGSPHIPDLRGMRETQL